MEIRNLPVPVTPYPASSAERDAASTSRQKNSGEEYTRSVKAAEQSQSSNTSLPQQTSFILQAQLQQRPRHHNGNLHDPQLHHSAQRAIDTYQDIENQDENSHSSEILSRVDALI